MPINACFFPLRQRGMALVVVLLILAVAVVIAAAMTERLGLQIRRADNLVSYSQAQQYALGAEQFAITVLKQDFKDSPNAVHLSQYWSSGEQIYPLENGLLIGRITDLQACFNLNAAAGRSPQQPSETPPLEMTALQQLLEQAGIESYAAETIAHSTRDWLDADDVISGSLGAEDGEYRGLQPPYVTANSLMASVSELRVMLDITPADYQLLAPFVCVVPEDNRLLLNVNTLTEDTAVLLAALIPELTEQAALDIIANRPEEGFATLEELFATAELSAITVPDEAKSMLALKSDSFQLTATAAYLESGFVLTSVLKINDNNQVKVLARRFGGQG